MSIFGEIEMFNYDAKIERENGYKNNVNLIYEQFKNIKTLKELKSYNKEALKRFIKNYPTNFSEISFINKCKDDQEFAYCVASCIHISPSRQGCTEEKKIINGIANSLKNSIIIETLPSAGKNALRPLRSGGIISDSDTEKDYKNSKIYLKTIDGCIKSLYDQEKILGYIFAKVVVGIGGHQDNVEKEADEFINWAANEPIDKLYVVLIDGKEELKNRLIKKQKNNIWVINHVEFQERLNEYVNAKTIAGTVLHSL